MKRIKLSGKTNISQINLGFWRLLDWQMSEKGLQEYLHNLLELGITTFDHADIYGNYKCEQLFGNAIRHNHSLRRSMEIMTKCGIKLKSDKFPKRKIKVYDTSKSHIIESVNTSLKNLSTDYIDLLLIHRPDPFIAPDEVAEAFFELEKDGKVLNFGVSNFSPLQFEMLHSFFDRRLVANQIEVSPYHLEHFDNGSLEYCIKESIIPMAWSPLAGGRLLYPDDEKSTRINAELGVIAKEMGIHNIEQLILAWLMAHPSGIIPVLGSGNIKHVKSAISSTEIELTREDWFRIYIAATGQELP